MSTTDAALALFAAAVLATFVGLVVTAYLRRARGPRGAGPLPVSDRFRDLVLRLSDPETRDEATEAIEAAGAAAVPDLLAVLSGERAAWDDATVRATHARAMSLLGRIGDARARPVLESHVIRETHLAAPAAWALATAGWTESLPLLEAALGGPAPAAGDVVVEAVRTDGDVSRSGRALHEATGGGSPDVRDSVVDGIRCAASLGRVSPECRRRLAPHLAALVGRRACAAAGLLALDPAAAPIVLVSGDVLRDRRDLVVVEEVFGALAAAGAPIDGSVVLDCLGAFPPDGPVVEEQFGALAALAMALAASGHAEARPRLERMRASRDPRARRAGVAGLLVLERLWRFDVYGGDLDVEFAETPSEEPTDARRAAWYAMAFREAAGLELFLESAAGRSPAEAAAALRAVGVPAAAAIVEDAAALFRGGVPADDEERARRLGAACEGGHPFLDLDERAQDCAEDVRFALDAWVLDHAAEFRRSPDASPTPGATAELDGTGGRPSGAV